MTDSAIGGKIATVALMRHGGSHLVRPIVARLGFDIIEPGNFGAPLDQQIGPVIVFLRDPRNRMVSTLRWWKNKPRKAAMVYNAGDDNDTQLRYLLEEQEFLEEMLDWARIWCQFDGSRLKLNFENMDSLTIGSIRRHLDLPPDELDDKKIFYETYGTSRTYTGSHSNWKDYFGPLSMEYWNKNGGNELMRLMGYK